MEVEFLFSNLDETEFNDVLLSNINVCLHTVCMNKNFEPALGNIESRYNSVFFHDFDLRSN